MKPFHKHKYLNAGAFSLAEVVIALAIAAMGFVSLLGLLPQGLQMSRQAADLGAQTRITQQISAELNSTPWNLINWNPGYGDKRYFDDQGVEIPESELGSRQMEVTYVATIYIPTGTGSNTKKVQLPTGTMAANLITPESYMRKVRVYVATTPNPSFSFESAAVGRIPFTTLLLTKIGTEAVPE